MAKTPEAARELLERLDTIDLTSLTLADIEKISSPVVRKVLAELVSDALRVRAEHTNHGKFSSHLKNIVLDQPIIDNPLKK